MGVARPDLDLAGRAVVLTTLFIGPLEAVKCLVHRSSTEACGGSASCSITPARSQVSLPGRKTVGGTTIRTMLAYPLPCSTETVTAMCPTAAVPFRWWRRLVGSREARLDG